MQASGRKIVVALGLAALASCQAIAGIESRTLDPPPPGPDGGCVLPNDGPAHVRYINLVPSDEHVDVCIRPAGASSYGRPLFRNGGVDCDIPDLAYTDVTRSIGAPAASVDIKFVPAGQTCSAAALSETLGVALPADRITTIMRIGGFGAAEQIVALPEEQNDDPVNLRVRFVHAAPGLKPLFMGVTHDAHLPTVIDANILSAPVPFGQTVPSSEKPQFGTIDESGYLVALPAAFEIGAAEDGSTKALLHTTLPNAASTVSLYAIGAVGSNNKYPVRGLVCHESRAPAEKPLCVPTTLPSLSVTAFNVALFGPNANEEQSRRQPLYDAIKGADADVMCLYEVARQDPDQNAIAKLYPYAYAPKTDLNTPFTDPKDQNGDVPPPATTAPCGGVPTQEITDVYTCMESNCSTAPPGDPTGALPGTTACLSSHCASKFLPILTNYPNCFACIIDYVESQAQYGVGQNACTTDLRQPFAFNGQNPTMLLSRYPLTNQEIFVLPSTNFRRAVLYAQAQLENQTVDVFCGFLTSTLIYSDIPYTGQYGNGADPATEQAYLNEQQLQARKIVSYVQKKSGDSKHPGILIGDWHASMKVPDPANAQSNLVDELHPQTVQIFRDAFQYVNYPKWRPSCSDCPAPINGYNGDVTSKWLFYEMYLVNWPNTDNATIDESIIFNQPVVSLPDGTNGMLSLYFGLNAKVLRPQQ